MMTFFRIFVARGTTRIREVPPSGEGARLERAVLSVVVDLPTPGMVPPAVNPPSRRGSPIPYPPVMPSPVAPDVPPPFR